MSASPAINPEASSTPVFSVRTACPRVKFFRFWIISTIPFTTPPRKIAKVVSSGRYIPTLTSIGLFTCIRINPRPMSIPTIISGHAICPPTIPCESMAIRLAWGQISFCCRSRLHTPGSFPGNISFVQDNEHAKHHNTCEYHTDDITDLHPPRGTAKDVPCFQILKHLTGHSADTHTIAATPSTEATPS